MVVTAGATTREPEERIAGGVDPVADYIVALEFGFTLGDLSVLHSGREKAGRLPSEMIVRRDFISRELPLNKLVIGQIAVEGPDQEIAVGPGMAPVIVILKAALSAYRATSIQWRAQRSP